MNRQINLEPWKVIFLKSRLEHHTLQYIATTIIENSQGHLFYIEDDIEKIEDVSSMPNYIKEDWLNYNKKELTEKFIDAQIQFLMREVKNHQTMYIEYNEMIQKLKSIKRELKIKKIL